jgi:predicted negative regulator of RcsB-dependent stress response
MPNGDGALTIQEFWTILMAGCSALITLSAAAVIVINAIKKLREPENVQNKQIEELRGLYQSVDARLKIHEEYFNNDKKKISAIEEGNRVTQKALLALMSHAINGNDVDKLKEAENSLREYLINRE